MALYKCFIIIIIKTSRAQVYTVALNLSALVMELSIHSVRLFYNKFDTNKSDTQTILLNLYNDVLSLRVFKQ